MASESLQVPPSPSDAVITTRPGRSRWIGAVFCILSAAEFSTLPVLSKLAFAAGVSLAGLLTVRFLGSALLLWSYLAPTHRRNPLPGRREALRLLGLGIVFAGQAALYFSGVRRLPASVAILLNYLYPVHVAIMAWAIARRAPGRREWGAMILALTGVALTAGAGAFGKTGSLDPIGVLFALASSLGYAVFITASNAFKGEVTAVTSTALITTSAGLFYVLAGGFGSTLALERSPYVLGLMAGIVVLGTALPLATLIAGIAIVGPTSASLLNTVEPVFTALLAAAFLGERLGSTQALGGLLILTAVILVSLPGQAVQRPIDTRG